MKKFTLTFSLLCAACALTFAGPEAIQSSGKDMKEVVQQPVLEMSCFQGWYLGVHGGGLYGNFNVDVTADEFSLGGNGIGPTPAFDRSGNGDQGGGEFGGQIGFNWQKGKWVFGFEADGSWSGLDQDHRADAVFNNLGAGGLGDPDIFYSTRVRTNSSVDWYGTARLRVGHTIGQRVLPFLTGGLAYGGTSLDQRTSVFSFRAGEDELDTREGSAHNDDTSIGWTAGAGLDICLTHHIILNFTYLYVDLENSSVRQEFNFIGDTTDGGARHFDSIGRTQSDNNFHVFQGGLSFKF